MATWRNIHGPLIMPIMDKLYTIMPNKVDSSQHLSNNNNYQYFLNITLHLPQQCELIQPVNNGSKQVLWLPHGPCAHHVCTQA